MTGEVRCRSQLDYDAFRLDAQEPCVLAADAAVRAIGAEPMRAITNGGLDANWLVRHGIPTVTFGAGQNDIHMVGEWVDVPAFLAGCRLALALATEGE